MKMLAYRRFNSCHDSFFGYLVLNKEKSLESVRSDKHDGFSAMDLSMPLIYS